MGLKVLVVGASSGVGLQVVKALLEFEKYEVYALVRSQEKASKAIGPDASKVKFVNGDITKKDTLVPAVQGIDAVVCAVGAQAGWRLPGWNQYTPKYVDYLGSQNLIEAAEYKIHDDLAYYIVRPGGLNNNDGGKSGIIVEQGDTGTGSIPRRDVATIVLACIDGATKPNVTFEIYSDKKDETKDLKGLGALVPDDLK